MGDPGGIGPEVLVKSLSDAKFRAKARFLVFGFDHALRATATRLAVAPFWTVGTHARPPATGPVCEVIELAEFAPHSNTHWPPSPNAKAGACSFAWVNAAIDACLLPPSDPCHADAIVTGPIHKGAWSLAGHANYPGHTELLAERLGLPSASTSGHEGKGGGVMMFVSPRLMTSLVTTHIPLARVPLALTTERIERVIRLSHDACLRLGIASNDPSDLAPPRIAVCGLNPHAGEGGLLGHEDDAVIRPAIEAAQRAGINASGPWPGDTIFLSATRDAQHPNSRPKFDLVVAMYHDQGLIPVKLLDRDRAVNTTLGLRVPRTSPDHGTAFDIAGQGIANPGSMRAAIELAIRMSRPADQATKRV